MRTSLEVNATSFENKTTSHPENVTGPKFQSLNEKRAVFLADTVPNTKAIHKKKLPRQKNRYYKTCNFFFKSYSLFYEHNWPKTSKMFYVIWRCVFSSIFEKMVFVVFKT